MNACQNWPADSLRSATSTPDRVIAIVLAAIGPPLLKAKLALTTRWAEDVFDLLGWHDVHVHGFRILEGEHGTGQQSLCSRDTMGTILDAHHENAEKCQKEDEENRIPSHP
jgi:hypothetical protein